MNWEQILLCMIFFTIGNFYRSIIHYVEKKQKEEKFLEYSRVREQGTVETVTSDPGVRIQAIRDIVTKKQYAKVDGIMIDLFSASLIIQVYDNLNDDNRKRFASFPAYRMAEIAYKLMK